LTDKFKANTLYVNVNKTNDVIFTKSQDAMPHYTLKIGNKMKRFVTHNKFLVIIIDNTLNWQKHIDHSKKKMSRGLYAINASKHLKSIYHSLIH